MFKRGRERSLGKKNKTVNERAIINHKSIKKKDFSNLKNQQGEHWHSIYRYIYINKYI